jgi:hypothetical protein
MRPTDTLKEINLARRRFVGTAAMGVAAADVSSLLPATARAAAEDNAIRPFRVNVPEQELVELRRRVAATRWPGKETVTDESQGVKLETIQNVARYWQADHDHQGPAGTATKSLHR